jgi:two-component system sensor histidine kinase KdpD
VEQAIGNVIGNAIEHTPPDTQIIVDAQVEPNLIELRISDNGPGIPPDALGSIFEKFVTGHDATRADGSRSTGLGLAIAKGIMEAHGGAIAAESPLENGRGSRFSLRFPREDVPS